MSPEDAEAVLAEFKGERPEWSETATALAAAKAAAVELGNEELSRKLWCLEQTLKAQREYVSAFQLLRASKFYQGWCELERLELTILFLGRHFRPRFEEFSIGQLERWCRQWQKLFPYKIFMSPEIIELEKICSICEQPVRIRHHCGHSPGEIYGGELCGRIVTRSKLVGNAFVESPVQKYSVPFVIDPKSGEQVDNYDYSLVRFAALRLQSPVDDWHYEWTKKRHPHSRFSQFGRNDRCPCESGLKYKRCCLNEDGVLRPHLHFVFEVDPPAHLPGLEYSE